MGAGIWPLVGVVTLELVYHTEELLLLLLIYCLFAYWFVEWLRKLWQCRLNLL